MMNKRYVHPASVFFLLTVFVAFFSWVGSIYGWVGIQSLLSAEGLRWELRNVEDGFLHSPFLGTVLLMSFGVGLWIHSGLWILCKNLVSRNRKPSRKERRALILSVTIGAIYALGCLVLVWGPWADVRSITGSLHHSPLADGAFCLLSLGLGGMAVVYAYATDAYNSDRDIVIGMSYGLIRLSSYVVTLFFIVQFFTSFRYTGLFQYTGLPDKWFNWLYGGCCLLSLLLAIRPKSADSFDKGE